MIESKGVMKRNYVLVFEDNVADAEAVCRSLACSGLDIIGEVIESSRQLFNELLVKHVLAVFIDYSIGLDIGMNIVERAKIKYPSLPFILLMEPDDESVVSEALRVGAKECLKKDDLNEHVLRSVIGHILNYWEQEDRLKKQSALLFQQAVIIDSTSDAVLHANLNGDIIFMNRSAQLLFGTGFKNIKSLDSFVARLSDKSGQLFEKKIVPDLNDKKCWKGELNLVTESGCYLPISMNIFPMIENYTEVGGFAAIMRDVRDEKAKENLLNYAEHHDPLTGLPNRALITQTMSDAVKRAIRQNTLFAVLLLDLDHFKGVNDTLGHDGGDELLKRVAKRLCSTVRSSDRVGRLGGDEFVIILENIIQANDVAQLACRILTLMKVPSMIQGHRVYITPSMGIATYPHCGETAGELLQKADMAMYHTKSSGRNGFQFYAESLQQAALLHAKTKQHIILGLQNNSFFMVYQEIVNRDGLVAGWEALVRWKNEEGKVMGPDQFIPVAEQTGLIVDLGHWIIRTAIEQFSLLVASRGRVENPTLSINLSALQLYDQDLLGCLQRHLEAANIPISQVILELTESALIEKDNHSFKVIESLANAGFTLAMDDFGTGYASFKHLQQLPISIVKIDRSFITNVDSQPSKAAIVDALLSMADALELNIVVEGIETLEERQFFQTRRCDKFQGYYYHKPSAV